MNLSRLWCRLCCLVDSPFTFLTESGWPGAILYSWQYRLLWNLIPFYNKKRLTWCWHQDSTLLHTSNLVKSSLWFPFLSAWHDVWVVLLLSSCGEKCPDSILVFFSSFLFRENWRELWNWNSKRDPKKYFWASQNVNINQTTNNYWYKKHFPHEIHSLAL